MESPRESYIALMHRESSTPPISMSEDDAVLCISGYLGEMIESLDDCRSGSYPGVFLYEIAEDKKKFDVLTVRRAISDMSIRPYSGKNIYIFRGFGTATLEAQNAMLKSLEESSDYMVIILIVSGESELLETIESRVMHIAHTYHGAYLDEDLRESIDLFFSGSREDLMGRLHI
jgi:DNA polymerase III, delta subunit